MNEDMCTKSEVKEVVHAELREQLPELVGNVISQKTGKFLLTFWSVIISLIVASAGAWFGLYYQVQRNSDELTVGERYTQEEHDMYARSEREYVDSRIDTLAQRVDLNKNTIELSIQRIENAVSRIENVIISNK